MRRQSGMILVTGPTGSGKTTTLYAALASINTPERKIITVEDPIEYQLPGVNQVQIHDKIELTFARVLRSALRQDPDVILVGEMRDRETVEPACARQDGHLVLSTRTPTTRVDADAAPRYGTRGTWSPAPPLVIAQRLVRIVCESSLNPTSRFRRAAVDRSRVSREMRAIGQIPQR